MVISKVEQEEHWKNSVPTKMLSLLALPAWQFHRHIQCVHGLKENANRCIKQSRRLVPAPCS